MNILAIDCGTKTGWAALKDCSLEHGTETFDLQRGESRGLRFLRFSNWLREMGVLVMPKLIVYEQAHYRGGAPTEILVGMTTRVQEYASAHGLEYAACHTGALKKFATGNGRAEKEQMREAAKRLWGLPQDEKLTYDEADALCLLAWAKERYGE